MTVRWQRVFCKSVLKSCRWFLEQSALKDTGIPPPFHNDCSWYAFCAEKILSLNLQYSSGTFNRRRYCYWNKFTYKEKIQVDPKQMFLLAIRCQEASSYLLSCLFKKQRYTYLHENSCTTDTPAN